MTIDQRIPADVLALLEAARRDGARLPDVVAALERLARGREEPDLVLLGALARVAWSALHAETEAVLRAAGPPLPAPEPDAWGEILSAPWLDTLDEEGRVTSRILDGTLTLVAPGRRPACAPRAVTLDELADALRAAYVEAAAFGARAEDAAARRRARRAARARAPSVVHGDDVGREMRALEARLPADGSPVVLREIAPSPGALVGALMAALELARRGRVRIDQEGFPFGAVRVGKPGGAGAAETGRGK